MKYWALQLIQLFLNEKQPWLLIKDKKNYQIKEIIYSVLETRGWIVIVTFIAELSSKINIQPDQHIKDVPWEQQLKWGQLISNSVLQNKSNFK